MEKALLWEGMSTMDKFHNEKEVVLCKDAWIRGRFYFEKSS